MAKKIDASKQGNNYLTSLLGNREIVPLEEEIQENAAVVEEKREEIVKEEPSHSIQSERVERNIYGTRAQEVQPEEVSSRKKLGRKRVGDALKVGVCVSMDENLLNDLKKIAFVNHLKVSNIIEEHVAKYVTYHSQDIEEFEKLPANVKAIAGF